TAAIAQSTPATGLDVQRFRPGTGANDLLGVESAHVLEQGFHFGLVMNYSDEPLALRLADTGTLSTKIVNRQFTADLVGSVAFLQRFEVGLSVPVTLQSANQIPALQGSAAYSPKTSGVGDVRLEPRARLWGENRGLSFALSAPIVLP